MHTNYLKTPIAVPSFDSQKTLLRSTAGHRSLLATAMMALLPSVQALAQCAPSPPAALNISSGACEDPALTARENTGTVAEATGTGSYSATSTHLLVTNSGYGAHAAGGGTIALTDTSIQTEGADASTVFADVGGSITLNNSYVNINGNGSAGLFVTGFTVGLTTVLAPRSTTPLEPVAKKSPQLRGLSGFSCHQIPSRARRGIIPTLL